MAGADRGCFGDLFPRPGPQNVWRGRELFCRKIALRRRSIQSYVEISPFSLDESGSRTAVNNTFLSFRVRDKSAYERTGQ